MEIAVIALIIIAILLAFCVFLIIKDKNTRTNYDKKNATHNTHT